MPVKSCIVCGHTFNEYDWCACDQSSPREHLNETLLARVLEEKEKRLPRDLKLPQHDEDLHE